MSYKIPTDKRQFFNWKEYRDSNLIVAGGITIIVGGRNIGKTTGTFVDQLRDCNENEMMFYIRNTLKEIESYKTTFNTSYGEEFYMTDKEIWTLERHELFNKKTKQLEVQYRKKNVIGYVGTLNGTDGWRSADFSKIKYIFSDEFNQIGNSLNVEKFLTLWTSILRTKDNVYTILVGNRDDASSEIIVELGIDISVPENYNGDWIIPLLPNDNEFKDKAFFIDLDDRRFSNNDVPTIWKALGRETEVMGDYYDRGYKSYDNADCRKLRKDIMEKVSWDFSYKNDFDLIVGMLDDVVIVHIDNKHEYNPRLKFASIPQCAKNKGLTPIEHNIEYIFYYVTKAMKDESILYTSIAAKEDINRLINDLSYEMEDGNATIL